jgi:hypothetical protein
MSARLQKQMQRLCTQDDRAPRTSFVTLVSHRFRDALRIPACERSRHAVRHGVGRRCRPNFGAVQTARCEFAAVSCLGSKRGVQHANVTYGQGQLLATPELI